MRLLLLASLLLLVPGSTACSLLYEEFWQGDIDGDIVVTALGQDGVRINLATGQQSVVSQGFFPVLAAHGGYTFHQGQDGLGADCSGTRYFQALNGDGTEARRFGATDHFDVDGDVLARITGDTVTLTRIGTWATIGSFKVNAGQVSEGPFGPSGLEPVVAVDAAGKRVAASNADGDISIRDFQGKQVAAIDAMGERRPLLDWHKGQLVIGTPEAEAADFWVIEDLSTGAARVVRITGEARWNAVQIASGEMLLVQWGDKVVAIDGTTTRQLKVPSGHHIGAVAADPSGAVVLVQSDEDGERPAAGIQRIGANTVGTWYERDVLNRWAQTTGPGFSWAQGPPMAATSVGDLAGGPGGDEKSTPAPVAGAAAAAMAALLARRRA